VLTLRGKQGQCTDPAYAKWWCWPSNETNQGDGPKFVAAFEPTIATARRRTARAGRTLLLGFSNGAYFATLIATRALHPFDAVVIAHGGPVEPTEAVGAKVPLLLETATEDPSNGEMQRLAEELEKAEWPHEMFTRGGIHDLPLEDVEAALAFFDKTRPEPPEAGSADAGAADAGGDAGDDDDDDDAGSPKLPDVTHDDKNRGCGGFLGR
jgi:predicted esterase